MTNPFFSIIIPTLNEEKNLPILLDSIVNQDKNNFSENDFEVIVIDSLSTDDTKKIALSYVEKIKNFRFVEQKLKNVSAARNLGGKSARGEFLIFFDADVEIGADFFKNIKEKINKFNLEATTVWNRPKTKSFKGKIILYLLNISMSLFQNIKPAANGPCIIIKKDIFNKAKGFDEQIVFGEDFDLIQRVGKLKAKFMVFKLPILYVSTRRFEKEGLIISLYKTIKALLHQFILGPIRKPIFEYEMGGQYYADKD